MNIDIKRALLDDAAKLIEVQNQSFLEDYNKYDECPSYQESIVNMVDMIENAIVYKIIVNKQIIGDIIIRRRSENHFYLRTISVIPVYQNLDIGKKAIRYIEKDNPEGTIWTLITPLGSPGNLRFYESLGYTKIGERIHSEKLTLVEYKKEIKPDD